MDKFEERVYEVTWVDTGSTTHLTESEAMKHFGEHEWDEIVMGCMPHIVAVCLDEEQK